MAHSLYDIRPLLPLIDEGCVLLTPNARLARRIKLEWDAHQQQRGALVWQPPAVQPLEQWLLSRWEEAVRLERLAPALMLDRAQELLRWRQIIEQAGGASLLSLLRPAAAAELAREARDRLLRWRVDYRAPHLRQRFRLEQDCDEFISWLEAFERELERCGHCTAADGLTALASTPPAVEPPSVALLECGEMSPLEVECLRMHSREVLQAPAASRTRRALSHPFEDERAEFEGVAAWAAQRHREEPDATLGIVLSGSVAERTTLEYLLRREFDCLGQDYHSLPVNFSAGIRLVDAPVVRDALLALSTGLAHLAVADVEALLRSRYLDLPDRDGALAAHFVRRLYEGGSAELELGALRNFASTVRRGGDQGLALGHHLLAMQRLRELRASHPPSAWATHFNAVLDIWGWPGRESPDSLEYQQVARWEQTLDEFRALDAVSGPLDYAGALDLLGEACGRQLSQPQTADSPIQVLGPLEAVGLQFDHLWVCGMQASSWPAAPRPNPLIPLALQMQKDMPHASAEREWAFAENLLGRYRHACRTLHGSYSRAREGVPELPSALLAGFEERCVSGGERAYPPWCERQARGRRETLADHGAPPVSEGELATLSGGAALVEDQSQCPFRAFARRRLKVAPWREFSPGISPLERGIMVHEALQALWAGLGDHATLVALQPAARAERVDSAVRDAVAALPAHRRHAVGPACVSLETERLRALLLEWLEVESQRGAFAVEALEADIELTLVRLPLRLRVDRIDRLPGGARVIIDYKTGRAKLSDWLGERPRKPQLPLYSLAGSEPPAALAFAQLRPRESCFEGIGCVEGIPGVREDVEQAVRKHDSAADWETLNAAWRASLERLARSFVAGDARVDPLRDACKWCGLQPLCRVDATADPESEEEGEAAP